MLRSANEMYINTEAVILLGFFFEVLPENIYCTSNDQQ